LQDRKHLPLPGNGLGVCAATSVAVTIVWARREKAKESFMASKNNWKTTARIRDSRGETKTIGKAEEELVGTMSGH